MRGLITFDTENGQVIVKGFANWNALIFSLVWLGLPTIYFIPIWSNEGLVSSLLILLGVIGFYILVMGSLYWIQSSRFSKVALFAAQSWSRKYVRDSDHA